MEKVYSSGTTRSKVREILERAAAENPDNRNIQLQLKGVGITEAIVAWMDDWPDHTYEEIVAASAGITSTLIVNIVKDLIDENEEVPPPVILGEVMGVFFRAAAAGLGAPGMEGMVGSKPITPQKDN